MQRKVIKLLENLLIWLFQQFKFIVFRETAAVCWYLVSQETDQKREEAK